MTDLFKNWPPPVEIAPDMPEDEIRLVSSTGLVHKMVNVGKPQVIEPAAVEKMPRGYFLGVDTEMVQAVPVDPAPYALRPTPLMRRFGYTRHPFDCGHYNKRLYLGTTRWICSDCGEVL